MELPPKQFCSKVKAIVDDFTERQIKVRAMEITKTFEYASTEEANHRVINDLNLIMDQLKISREESNPFVVAVSEAFTNAVVHGNRKNPDKKVFLRITINENLMSADIVDEGQGGLDRIRQRKPSGPSDEGGRGIDLIEYYSTSVGYLETPTGGLKVEIKISRERNPVTD